jgi:hypothetical protein
MKRMDAAIMIFRAAAQGFRRVPNNIAVATMRFDAAIKPIVAAEISILPRQ